MVTLETMMADVYQLEEALQQKFNRPKAQQHIDALDKNGRDLAKIYFSGGNSRDIPLPIALRLVKIISHEDIQWCHDLKYALSQTCRLFLENVLYKSRLEGLKLPDDSKEEAVRKIDRMLSALPETEIRTRLELECSLAAIRALSSGSLWKRYFFSGVKATATLSTGDFLDLLGRMWMNERQSGDWFTITAHWRWVAFRIEKLEDFHLLEQEMAQHFEKGKNFSLAASEILMAIMENAADDTLKNTVFSQGKVNLLALTKLQTKKDKKFSGLRSRAKRLGKGKNFWLTRYRTVEHLGTLCQKTSYAEESFKTLTDRLLQETNIKVINLLFSLYFTTGITIPWTTVMLEMKQMSVFKTRLQDYNQHLEQSGTKIKTKEMDVEKAKNEVTKTTQERIQLATEVKNIKQQSAGQKQRKKIELLEKEKEEEKATEKLLTAQSELELHTTDQEALQTLSDNLKFLVAKLEKASPGKEKAHA